MEYKPPHRKPAENRPPVLRRWSTGELVALLNSQVDIIPLLMSGASLPRREV